MTLEFSGHQLGAISITERVCSAVSLAASGIVVATFVGTKSFRRPINRLVFYASFGNIMANVGTMVSQSGIHYGRHSSLCQFQAFIIQWLVFFLALREFQRANRCALGSCLLIPCGPSLWPAMYI